MSLQFSEHNIEKISIIDDDIGVRREYENSIIDIGLIPIHEEGPLENLQEFIIETKKRSNAAICDHKLIRDNYSEFNGAEIVANFYEHNFPAILCTGWKNTNTAEIRRYIKNIPVYVDAKDFEADDIITGIEKCINEFKGKFSSERKPWRTVIRIDEIQEEKKVIYVNIPAWSARDVVSLTLNEIEPIEIRESIDVDKHYYAKVNIGTENKEELYFFEWENI